MDSDDSARKTLLEKVMEAIQACEDKDGASRKYVRKFLKAKYGLGNRSAVKKLLDKAISDGRIEIIEGNNRLRVAGPIDVVEEEEQQEPSEYGLNHVSSRDIDSLRGIADDLQEEQDDLRDQIEFALQHAAALRAEIRDAKEGLYMELRRNSHPCVAPTLWGKVACHLLEQERAAWVHRHPRCNL